MSSWRFHVWAKYLVALAIFVWGAIVFFGPSDDRLEAYDVGRSHSDEKFSGLLMMLVGVLICIWI